MPRRFHGRAPARSCRQAGTSSLPAGAQDRATGAGPHAEPETVSPRTATVVGLERALHLLPPRARGPPRLAGTPTRAAAGEHRTCYISSRRAAETPRAGAAATVEVRFRPRQFRTASIHNLGPTGVPNLWTVVAPARDPSGRLAAPSRQRRVCNRWREQPISRTEPAQPGPIPMSRPQQGSTTCPRIHIVWTVLWKHRGRRRTVAP